VSSAQVPAWAEHARGVLRDAGHKRGGARDAVISVLAGQPCALTAQEIDDRLRAEGQRVGRASVYRGLDLLAVHRLVQRVETGEGLARYEPVRPDVEHHHHLICERCGKLIPFHDPELERAIGRLARRMDFDVTDHEVALRGVCRACESS
jgi:Fur family transcriptional regulator, ferric uptake regulator